MFKNLLHRSYGQISLGRRQLPLSAVHNHSNDQSERTYSTMQRQEDESTAAGMAGVAGCPAEVPWHCKSSCYVQARRAKTT
jgi:hypothetical protein